MNLELNGKTVLVTGGAAGIGEAAVRAFAAEGARVFFADKDIARGTALAGQVPGVRFMPGDLSDSAFCEGLISGIVATAGALDVLVNNAGVNDSVPLEGSPADFTASLNRNLLHVFALAHSARAALISSGGCIVNVSSKVAETGQGATSGYAAAKGAVNALTREWAAALAPHGVRVNAVVPAECDTEQYRRWFASQPDPEAARRKISNLVPLGGRLTDASEVADAILFLASARASHITGQLIHIDGGYTHLDRGLTGGHPGWQSS
jgi:L-fucose dehydrogenase